MGEPQRIRENLLHVPKVVDQVRNDNEIEPIVFQVNKMRIRFDEPEAGMFGMRAMNHGRAEIDADANRWRDGSEKVSVARAQLQNAHPGRNQEPVKLGESLLISAAQDVE